MSSEALWMQIMTNACPFHCHAEGESRACVQWGLICFQIEETRS